MVSETISSTAINDLAVARQAAVLRLLLLVLPDAWGRCRLGLQPIMGAACQEPLGTCFLINALSDGVSTIQRLARGGKGKEKVIASVRNAWTGAVVSAMMMVNMVCFAEAVSGWEHCEVCFYLSAQSNARLWFPLPVFWGDPAWGDDLGMSPVSPWLPPPAIVTHELLINLGNRKDITGACLDLPLLWWISANTKQICICIPMITWDFFKKG